MNQSVMCEVLLVTRVRGLLSAWIIYMLLFIGFLFLPKGIFHVLGRDNVYNHIWPIYFSLFGVSQLKTQKNWERTAELTAPRPRRRQIIDLLLIYLGLAFSSSIVLFSAEFFAQALRNALFFVALSACCYRFLRSLAWLPGVGYAFVIWLLGTDILRQPKPWALPLLPAHNSTALGIVAGLIVISFLAERIGNNRAIGSNGSA